MNHKCAIPECDRRVPGHLLMCPGHWTRVARSTQIQLNSAWREYLARPSKATITNYRYWRSRAIDSVTVTELALLGSGSEISNLKS